MAGESSELTRILEVGFKIISLIAALLGSSEATAQINQGVTPPNPSWSATLLSDGWTELAWSDDGTRIAFTKSALGSNTPYPKIWLRAEYETAKPTKYTKSDANGVIVVTTNVLSSMSLSEINCSAGMTRVLARDYYAGQNLRGEANDEYGQAGAWYAVAPGTVDEFVFNKVCVAPPSQSGAQAHRR